MQQLTFVTGNQEKFKIAASVFAKHQIPLEQAAADIDEIQADDGEKIVRDKAEKAFMQLRRPIVVNDDVWEIPGIGGFPGAYMKFVAGWFTPDDFIRLTSHLTDRRIQLKQFIAYQDASQQKIFLNIYTGELLKEPRGNYGNSLQKVISMPGDNGASVAEVYDRGAHALDREVAEGWRNFINWYKKEQI